MEINKENNIQPNPPKKFNFEFTTSEAVILLGIILAVIEDIGVERAEEEAATGLYDYIKTTVRDNPEMMIEIWDMPSYDEE